MSQYVGPWQYRPDGVFRRMIDHNDGTFGEASWQDCDAILEDNKRASNDYSRKFGDEPRMIADVPNAVLVGWMTKDGVDIFKLPQDELRKYLRRKLNDPEWSYLKRAPIVI